MYREILSGKQTNKQYIDSLVNRADKENMFSVKGIAESKVYFVEATVNEITTHSLGIADIENTILIHEKNIGRTIKNPIIVIMYRKTCMGLAFSTFIFVLD